MAARCRERDKLRATPTGKTRILLLQVASEASVAPLDERQSEEAAGGATSTPQAATNNETRWRPGMRTSAAAAKRGEEGGGEGHGRTHGDVTGRHARERGTDDASAFLVVKDTPRRITLPK